MNKKILLALILVLPLLISGCAQGPSGGAPQIPGTEKSALEEGKWYKYKWKSKGQDGETMNLDLILTEITEEGWRGIIGRRGGGYRGNEATLLKFKLFKNLSLRTSFPLKPSGLEEKVEYYSLKKFSGVARGDEEMIYFPLPIPLFKEMFGLYPPQLFDEGSVRLMGEHGAIGTLKLKGKVNNGEMYRMVLDIPDSGKINILTYASKPYPLVNLTTTEAVTDAFDIYSDGSRDYSLEDLRGYYSGYEMKTVSKASLDQIPLGPEADCPDGVTAELKLKNTGIGELSTSEIEVSRSIKPENPEASPSPSMSVSWEKDLLKPGETTAMSAPCTEPGISAHCRYTFRLGDQTIGVASAGCVE